MDRGFTPAMSMGGRAVSRLRPQLGALVELFLHPKERNYQPCLHR